MNNEFNNNQTELYQTLLMKTISNQPNETTNPLDQFIIRDFISLDIAILDNLHISLTNIGLYLSISIFTVLSLNLLATNYNKIVSNN